MRSSARRPRPAGRTRFPGAPGKPGSRPARALACLLRSAYVALAGAGLFLSAAAPPQAHAQEAARPAHPGVTTLPQLFALAGTCMACHNGLTSPGGQDISIGTDWRASMMANAARDPYWQAAVRRETMEHPEAAVAIQDECAKCHMPMARYQAHVAGELFTIFDRLPWKGAGDELADLAADGVSCTVCHQILPDGLGQEESFTGNFVIDTETPMGQRRVFGPFEVPDGPARAMLSSGLFQPAQARHIRESALCASCHTLYTHARSDGVVVGELPEQVPYLEWLNSDYPGERSCQSCHMPVVEGPTPISSVLPTEREGVARHVFRGGNFFMPRVFNRFRDELAVTALPLELDAMAMRTEENLRTRTAELAMTHPLVANGSLVFDVDVTNLAGHKLPTAYPSRRAWLHVTVTDGSGRTVFESGAFRPDGSISGNDNDAGAGGYEPHYTTIRDPGQVQIYESIMVDVDGAVTTGLLSGVRYVKDNRILPRGFDKAGADPDVATRGAAAEDGDFVGGSDRVRYVIPVADAPRPLQVRVALWYQPIAFRWARNLAGFQAEEPQRFVRYYDALSHVSALELRSVQREVR